MLVLFVVYLTQARVTLEEEPSVEKVLPTSLACGQTCGAFLCSMSDVGESSSPWEGPPLAGGSGWML